MITLSVEKPLTLSEMTNPKRRKARTKAELYNQMLRGLQAFLAALYELITDEQPPKQRNSNGSTSERLKE